MQLSTIGLGSWVHGTTVSKDDSVRLIHGAMDLGINFFDTANVYTNEWGTGTGDAERLLGEEPCAVGRAMMPLFVRRFVGKWAGDSLGPVLQAHYRTVQWQPTTSWR